MPLPENPQTREEMYLNGIATGSTDGLPDAPVTREEMYLDYIARNGGGGGGGGSSTLSGLTDVDISNPSDGQTLVYNASAGKWENGESGGMLIVPATGPDSYNCTLQKTWAEIDAAISNGIPCYFHFIENGEGYRNAFLSPLTMSVTEDDEYIVSGYTGFSPISFITDSPNGYPATVDEGGNT